MKPGWIIGITMAFVVLQLIAGICEMNYSFSDTPNRMQILLSPFISSYSNPGEAIFAFVISSPKWFFNLFMMFWFDYSFFHGAWQVIRFIFFLPISVGVVVEIVLTVMGRR